MNNTHHHGPNVATDSATKTVETKGPGRSRILTINGGSSSLKFALFDQTDPAARILSGRVERIGSENARWVTVEAGGGHKEDCQVDAPDQTAAVHPRIHTDRT